MTGDVDDVHVARHALDLLVGPAADGAVGVMEKEELRAAGCGEDAIQVGFRADLVEAGTRWPRTIFVAVEDVAGVEVPHGVLSGP
jgi:hypothetical protein